MKPPLSGRGRFCSFDDWNEGRTIYRVVPSASSSRLFVPCLGWCHAESQSGFIVYIAGVRRWRRLAGTLPCPRLCRVLWSQSHRSCQSGSCLVARFLLRREGRRALSCYRSVFVALEMEWCCHSGPRGVCMAPSHQRTSPVNLCFFLVDL